MGHGRLGAPQVGRRRVSGQGRVAEGLDCEYPPSFRAMQPSPSSTIGWSTFIDRPSHASGSGVDIGPRDLEASPILHVLRWTPCRPPFLCMSSLDRPNVLDGTATVATLRHLTSNRSCSEAAHPRRSHGTQRSGGLVSGCPCPLARLLTSSRAMFGEKQARAAHRVNAAAPNEAAGNRTSSLLMLKSSPSDGSTRSAGHARDR